MSRRIIQLSFLLLMMFSMVACVTTPQDPRVKNTNNICSIFFQYPDWYRASRYTAKRWGVPSSVQMAIVHQESGFNSHARPPRRKLLWIIPWTRPSSAYGYSQALKNTWENYKQSVRRRGVHRDAFEDAIDFIGWYAYQAHRRLGIPLWDAFPLYLAYHEGLGGFARRTYLRKPWLIRVAHKVKYRAGTYASQMTHCRGWLDRPLPQGLK